MQTQEFYIKEMMRSLDYTNFSKIGVYSLRSFFLITTVLTLTSCSISLDPVISKILTKKQIPKKERFYIIKENGKVIWKKKTNLKEDVIFKNYQKPKKDIKQVKGFIEQVRYSNNLNRWVYIIRDIETEKLTTFFSKGEIAFKKEDLIVVDIINNFIEKHTVVVSNYKNSKDIITKKKKKFFKRRTLSRKTPWIKTPEVENIDFN